MSPAVTVDHYSPPPVMEEQLPACLSPGRDDWKVQGGFFLRVMIDGSGDFGANGSGSMAAGSGDCRGLRG